MSTVGLKLGSLVIRTISKPIATAIKAQAREHPAFRRLCIRIAQSLHRADMRLRLGILRDAATIEKIEAAEKAAKLAAKEKAAASTTAKGAEGASTTASAVDGAAAHAHHPDGFAPAASHPAHSAHSAHSVSSGTTTFSTRGQVYHIRPLSEAKAIERGAAFISEFFLFTVAGSLILFESLRSRRKEANRQDIVTERLERLEERNRQDEARIATLEEEVWRLKGGKGPRKVVDVLPLWEEEEGKPKWWRRIWPAKWSSGAQEEEATKKVTPAEAAKPGASGQVGSSGSR